jgi:sirohydrochlorin ferrochelatase
VKVAVLLIAHGSRRRAANADLDWVADTLRQQHTYHSIRTSYLELTEPTIAVGGAQCVSDGADRVILLPYFLSPGVHVRDDLTAARSELAQQFPQVEFRLAEPLGQHPLLLQVVAERTAEANATSAPP